MAAGSGWGCKPIRPDLDGENMARSPAPAGAHEPETRPADRAFRAALKFVDYLAMLAAWARRFDPSNPQHPPATFGHMLGHDEVQLAKGRVRVPTDWDAQAFNFAEAFIAWDDLTHLRIPDVLVQARRVYPAGAASIKLRSGPDATPYPTLIEAVESGLGIYFRNVLYSARRHPLEPHTGRVAEEAKARATARQVAQGKPSEPLGWGADYDELIGHETREAVWARLGLRTSGDMQDLMAGEWKSQGLSDRESAVALLKCEGINFPEPRTQLIREAEAVLAAANRLDAGGFPSPANLLREPRAAPAASGKASEDTGDEEDPIPLTLAGRRVLKAMRGVAPNELLTVGTIEQRARVSLEPVSDKTIRNWLRKFIDAKMVETPEGPYGGYRLTKLGRELSQKITA
ncbi:MAG: hypothetical protein H7Y88_02100 [Phycisphaerales bacterium]|nr:hypothetical protein [Phycisphaerales bacterium]